MRRMFASMFLAAAVGWLDPALPGPAHAEDVSAIAAPQTVVFAIDNMTCALCPVTVRTAMAGVAGVSAVDVDFDSGTATVTFDPAATSPEAIGRASGDAGYPARVVEG